MVAKLRRVHLRPILGMCHLPFQSCQRIVLIPSSNVLMQGGSAFGIYPFNRYRRIEVYGGVNQYREQFADPAKRFVLLTVEAGDCDAPYMSTLWHGGKVVGETTSGNWGYRVGKSIALGMLSADLAVPGTEIEVEIYGDRFKATVQPDGPLFDPNNERLRA